MDRNCNSFWAVWKHGLDWPELFASEELAKDRAHSLARSAIGDTVHLLKLTSVGAATYPATPQLSGGLARTGKSDG